MSAQCPKGFICINNFNVLTIVLVVLLSLYFFNKENNRKLFDKIQEVRNESKKDKTKLESTINESKIEPDIEYDVYDRDMTALRDPLYPPLKRNFHIDSRLQYRHRHLGEPNITHSHGTSHESTHLGHLGIPINVETRGPSEDYQQVGMLYKEAITDETTNPGNNSDSTILPLFGKPTYRGSNNWLYYTSSDKLSSVKIPLTYENRDCTDDQGCREINDGDTLSVPSYNGNFKVKLYKFDKPRYIPYVY